MKEYGNGILLSLGIAVLLIVINAEVYHGVMTLNLPLVFLALHVLAYRHYLLQKRYGAYCFFILAFGATIFFSLPALTHQQVEAKALSSYDLEEVKATTVPVILSWNPFAPALFNPFL